MSNLVNSLASISRGMSEQVAKDRTIFCSSISIRIIIVAPCCHVDQDPVIITQLLNVSSFYPGKISSVKKL